MTTPMWCLALGLLLPYLLAGWSVVFRMRADGAVDLPQPRRQAAALTDAGARVVAAQHNAWEALIVFAVAVLIGHLGGADPEQSALAAMVWLAFRVGHGVFYTLDFPKMRVLCFVGGLACAVRIIVSAA